ncbi:phage shock protein operon transcriptional activator [Thaumasiovibrio sp. DFM-14]|uniref:phage shock protein operon transcriptional activator n=1 Tax=Thaumasiovibrio sp. DFM-14 TaxID=3384792 RepID=UPI0039A12CC1
MTNTKLDSLIGESDRFLAVIDHVSRLAKINKPVLILGERGTGKELIAQRLHYLSPRWDKPLISLNCATLNENLIDSELFGHEAGAFTDAKRRHAGRFERAESGTLFLDELATCPFSVQEKLLKIIEYGQYERVGGQSTLHADVRLICATNADLPALAKQGAFRADLLDRLAFDVIHLPPLRERTNDIMLLAEYFALKMCRELDYPLFAGFSPKVSQALMAHPWPGNIRELKNVVERAVFHHCDPESPINDILFDPFTPPWQVKQQETKLIAAEHEEAVFLPALPVNLREFQTEQESTIVQAALKHHHYNQKKTAATLGLSYHQLRGLLRKHQLLSEGENEC